MVMILFLWLWTYSRRWFTLYYKETTDVVQVAILYFWEVYQLHGLPYSIVSDLDTRFLSHFAVLCGICSAHRWIWVLHIIRNRMVRQRSPIGRSGICYVVSSEMKSSRGISNCVKPSFLIITQSQLGLLTFSCGLWDCPSLPSYIWLMLLLRLDITVRQSISSTACNTFINKHNNIWSPLPLSTTKQLILSVVRSSFSQEISFRYTLPRNVFLSQI